MQSGWKRCKNCQALAFSLHQPSVCPAGGNHDCSGSSNYALHVDEPAARGQSGWRWCKKCTGLAFSLNQPSVCPAGEDHDHSASGNYTLTHDDPSAQGQSDWRWCGKCQGLAFALNQPSVCPAGGTHDHTGSGNYTLLETAALDVEEFTNTENSFGDSYSTLRLSGSVGRRGDNKPEDVILVQTLLNAVPLDSGGPRNQIKVDGKCGDQTAGAIQAFQLKHFGWKLADGRLDQIGLTWQMLTNIIARIAPILLQVGAPAGRRTFNVWLRTHSGKPGFNYHVMNIITYDLFDLFLQVLPQTTRFEPSPSISWFPTAAQIGAQDLLVYFLDKPSDAGAHHLLPDPNAASDAGGATGFLATPNAATGQPRQELVMQVYCIEQSQDTLRPGEYLARLAFHEMMHGRTDIGPTPRGVDPATGRRITNLHDPRNGLGLAEFPTRPWAQLTPKNREIMAHNLHRDVNLYTGAL